jgi:LuxR family maltose regulon positive regulatory protein
MIQGAVTHLLGDRATAQTLLKEAVRKASGVAPAVETVAHAQLCLVALDEGRLGAAEDAASMATRLVTLYSMESYAGSEMPFVAQALTRARRGQAGGARSAIAAADQLMSSARICGWFDAQVRVTAARAQIALGSYGEARSNLAEAAACSRRFPEAPVLAEWLEAADSALESAGDNELWPLTPAELRLLPMLPSHLTFAEMADRLSVSTNTVKTQIRSIYRKLGVFSRSEAVACAEATGLLDRSRDDAQSPVSG